jgi:hypothetical protein
MYSIGVISAMGALLAAVLLIEVAAIVYLVVAGRSSRAREAADRRLVLVFSPAGSDESAPSPVGQSK